MEVSKQVSPFAYIRSWVLFPFNLWLWTVTIPLRIFLYFAFGDFWKWSKNGKLPSRPEVKITNGKIISQSETTLRSYQVTKTQKETPRRLHVGKSVREERYPTYISTEIYSEQPKVEQQPQKQQFFEKAPTFFTVDKEEVEKVREKDEDQRIHSFFSTADDDVPLNQTETQKHTGEIDNNRIHGFFNVNNQVNDRHIKVNKDKTPKKQDSKKEIRQQKEEMLPQEEIKPVAIEVKSIKAESKPIESKPVESKPVESKPAESKPVESKPSITQEQLLEKERIIESLKQQITDLEDREKRALQEKLDIESKFENESVHWKEDNEAATHEKEHLREVLDQRNKETFDLKQKIAQLKSQLHSHGDYKLDEHQEIKSVWKVPHHESDYTQMVAQQQYQQTHTKTFAEVLEEGTSPQAEVSSIGAN